MVPWPCLSSTFDLTAKSLKYYKNRRLALAFVCIGIHFKYYFYKPVRKLAGSM